MPSPENDKLYRPVDPKDSEIIELAKSLKNVGQLEAAVVTELDDTDFHYLASGHRRLEAAKLAGFTHLECRIAKVRRDKEPDKYLRLLREYNRQRDKTNAERLREERIDIDPADAHEALYRFRREQAAVDLKPIKTGQVRFRATISSAKRPLLDAVLDALEELRDFWPLSVRQISYDLLNDPPLRHAGKPSSVFKNERKSYQDLCDLVARGLLGGIIAPEAIADETRPVVNWDVHDNPRGFLRTELEEFGRGYSRDYMQSQQNFIVAVGEKNTLKSILHQGLCRLHIALHYWPGLLQRIATNRACQEIQGKRQRTSDSDLHN
jgi:hypothetical protein